MLIFLLVVAVVGSSALGTVLFAFTGRDRSVLFARSMSINVDGVKRSFLVANGSDAKPRSLVIGLHGYGGDGRQLAYYTALHNAFGSDTMVVYPNASRPKSGQKPGWNADFCCGSGWKNKVDDVGFLEALIVQLRQKHGIPADRVFIVGFSNGAFMAQRFAAERPGLVRAVVSGAGTIGTRGTTGMQLRPVSPVPILLMHGAKDLRVMYQGGISPGDPEFDWLSFTDTAEAWSKTNRCESEPQVIETPSRRITKYGGCAAPLTTIEFLNDAHVWHGARLLNVWTRRPKASREAAAFFTSVASENSTL
jgi:poly(3-hydroxybutyrate) depolymerase